MNLIIEIRNSFKYKVVRIYIFGEDRVLNIRSSFLFKLLIVLDTFFFFFFFLNLEFQISVIMNLVRVDNLIFTSYNFILL